MGAAELLTKRARMVAAGLGGDVPSPCLSVCRVNSMTEFCEGCFRTLDEIAAWSRMGDEDKRVVWKLIGEKDPGPMKQITFYLDFISPYAYLAFEKLPQALEGLSYGVDYRPVLFAGMLKHHGQLGPAEIAGKREWTYRQVQWLGHSNGIALQMPAAHPFNPLPLLRLAVACGSQGLANRYVCETIFRFVWQGGADASDLQRVQALQALLAPTRDSASDEVKAELKANTEEAIARGLFGVPTCAVDDKLFWGFDSLPMLRAYLRGDAWFSEGAWDEAARLPGTQHPR